MSKLRSVREGVFQGSIGLALFLSLVVGGCVSTRGILDIRVRDVANPATGVAVRIARVTDDRHFERRPRQPSTPSLRHGRIGDPAITARAIARKRNGYGKALGDILLPEGRTVADVTAAVVTRGLRDAGFRVLEQGDPGYEQAAPLAVDVQQFWAWFTPGFFSAHILFEAQVTITGPVAPFQEGLAFRSQVRRSTQAATGRAWRRVIDEGVEELAMQVGTHVPASSISETAPAPSAYPASPARP